MSTNQPTVSIVFPCRNRESWLPTFLDCIYNLSFPKSQIELIVRLNDSQDSSEKILTNFKQSHEHEYNKIHIDKYDLGTPIYDSNRYARIVPKIIQTKTMRRAVPSNKTHEVYKNLAKHRNSLLLRAKGDFLFSVDTDIMLKPDTLNVLLNHMSEDVPYVSAHICNGFIVEKLNNDRAYNYTNALYYDESKKKHIHYKYETSGLTECSFSGAVFLVKKEAYKSGATFSFDSMGEDLSFCQGLIDRGFKIWTDCDHKLAHCMDADLLEKYKKGEWIY